MTVIAIFSRANECKNVIGDGNCQFLEQPEIIEIILYIFGFMYSFLLFTLFF